MLSRVDERIGFMTPQQPILTNKVLIPTEQRMALNDDYKSVKRLNLCTYIAKVFLNNM